MNHLRSEVISDLAQAGLAPLHRLGQNFMIDGGALTALTDDLGCAPGLRVIEIGPGTGLLTARMLAAGCNVLAVELDKGLHSLLLVKFASAIATAQLQLIHGDCLVSKSVLHPAIVAFAQGPWRLGANLPYDVALPVLLNAVVLQGAAQPPQAAVVTVQWEAAVRLCSHPGEEAWGASAAVLQAAGDATIVRRLAASSFHPPPRVSSAILRWQPRQPVQSLPVGFGVWCRLMFSSRRKVLVGALRDRGVSREEALAACAACGLDSARRLENLSASELVALHTAIGALPHGAEPDPSSLPED